MDKEFVPSPLLKTKFVGFDMRSPVVVGAVGRPFGLKVTPEQHAGVLLKHVFEGGVGAIIIPNVTYCTDESLKRVLETSKAEKKVQAKYAPAEREIPIGDKAKSPYGLEGVLSLNTWPTEEAIRNNEMKIEEDLRMIEIFNQELPDDVAVIAMLRGYGAIPDTYVDAAKFWGSQKGVDILETCWCCPAWLTVRGAVEDYFDREFGAYWPSTTLGQIPEMVAAIQKEITANTDLPTGIKVIREIGFPDIIDMARQNYDAGCRFMTLTGGELSVAPPDIYNDGKTSYPFTHGNAFAAMFGSCLRPGTYKHVTAVKQFLPEMEVAASGGLVEPQHAVEAMFLGANQVQYCTGVLEQGRGLLRRTNKFIAQFMEQQGYEHTSDFIGKSLETFGFLDDVDFDAGNIVQYTDPDVCNNCGVCADHCCICRHMVDGKLVVDENCSGCGWCLSSCRRGAISLKQKVAKEGWDPGWQPNVKK